MLGGWRHSLKRATLIARPPLAVAILIAIQIDHSVGVDGAAAPPPPAFPNSGHAAKAEGWRRRRRADRLRVQAGQLRLVLRPDARDRLAVAPGREQAGRLTALAVVHLLLQVGALCWPRCLLVLMLRGPRQLFILLAQPVNGEQRGPPGGLDALIRLARRTAQVFGRRVRLAGLLVRLLLAATRPVAQQGRPKDFRSLVSSGLGAAARHRRDHKRRGILGAALVPLATSGLVAVHKAFGPIIGLQEVAPAPEAAMIQPARAVRMAGARPGGDGPLKLLDGRLVDKVLWQLPRVIRRPIAAPSHLVEEGGRPAALRPVALALLLLPRHDVVHLVHRLGVVAVVRAADRIGRLRLHHPTIHGLDGRPTRPRGICRITIVAHRLHLHLRLLLHPRPLLYHHLG